MCSIDGACVTVRFSGSFTLPSPFAPDHLSEDSPESIQMSQHFNVYITSKANLRKT